MDFSENFLHFIWQYRLFNTNQLFCVDGDAIQVLHPGILNKDAGPDFYQAKLIIGQTTWVGHVEIHLKSSDWLVHGHQNDPFYDAVILHVVYQYDKPIYRTNGSRVPVLVLKCLFTSYLARTYHELVATVNRFPCEKHIASVDPIVVNTFLTRIIVERFEQKSTELFSKLQYYKGDWEQTFYYFLAKNFGFKVNAVPFEQLAHALPLRIIFKHKSNAVEIAALIFGQAGFLTQEFSESYPKQLQTTYLFLKKKYGLSPMDKVAWKFLRMRPQNFPTIRIAQFTALLAKSNHLFSKVLKNSSLEELCELFNALPVPLYWKTHYHFNKKAKQVTVQPGIQSVHNILINTICLFLFAYGKYTDQPCFIERAVDFLEKIPAENNSIIDEYKKAGVKVDCAFTSQALLQLKKSYCNQKKCLNCGIGIKILKK